MKIERHDVAARMSKVVVHGDTVYLAGIVADNPKGKNTTRADQKHSGSDRRLSGQGRHRQDEIAVGQYLDHRHGQFRRDECGVGRLGVARQYAGARDGRGQARHARLQGRDHGGGSARMIRKVGTGFRIRSCAGKTIKYDTGHSGDLQRRAAGREAEFEAWFQGEHLLETARRARLSVRPAAPGDFGLVPAIPISIWSRVAAVLTSKPYLERLDNPTPMTKKIMSEMFLNMNRTVCHRTCGAAGFAAPMP